MENQIDILEKKIKEATAPYKGMAVALSGGVDSSLLAALIEPKFVISVKLPGDERFNEIEYSSKVAEHLKIKHLIVDLDTDRFEESVRRSVLSIGRPIPHFNIFPLFEMYRTLKELGETHVILGDGPDETMCGYARDLIVEYIYKVYKFEAFKNYKPLIDKILPSLPETVERLTGLQFDNLLDANIHGMRPDMDDMSNGIGKYFGITNIRPYQDDIELDNYMRDLPVDLKIKDIEFGKYALRKVAERYLPDEIAWRKKKVGGPVFPVNNFMGWVDTEGEFGKAKWISYQERILNESN